MTRRLPAEAFRLRLTPSGMVGLLIILAMILTSMNYGNSMGFGLAFLILGVMIVSAIFPRINLRGLEIIRYFPRPAFAGERLLFEIEIENQSAARKMAVYLSLNAPGPEFFGPITLEPHEKRVIEMSFPVSRRGEFVLPEIILATLFPLGFFYGSRPIKVDKKYIVFPRPSGTRSWPETQTDNMHHTEGFHTSGGEDFSGLRPYRLGESQRHADWKAFARGRPLAIKDFSGGGIFQLWFDWDELQSVGAEERISQITRWILQADELGKEFGMRIPGLEIQPDAGTIHTLSCLTRLALFKTG